MSYGATPPPVTENLTQWAQNIVRYLQRNLSRLQFKVANASAADDGAILWDAVNGYPVVSKGNAWRQVVLSDGHAIFSQDVDITAAAADTAYKIALDNIAAQGITLTGSPLTEITFTEGGLYSLAFTAHILTTVSLEDHLVGDPGTAVTVTANLQGGQTSTLVVFYS